MGTVRFMNKMQYFGSVCIVMFELQDNVCIVTFEFQGSDRKHQPAD